MASLTRGMKGPEVRRLQELLRDRGFNPGQVDGDFGGGTEAAVIAFQRSEGLLADGVAGPRTLSRLRGEPIADAPNVIAGVTVEIVSEMFPHTPMGNIKSNLPHVLTAMSEARLTDKPMLLMALATIRAETENFLPVAEGQSRFNTSPNGHPFDLYDNRSDLGNRGKPDGTSFRGRGYVQLTGRHNYRRYGAEIGLGDELVGNPDRASEPTTAAKLLAAFLAPKELAIKGALLADDLRAARRLVNGGSHGLDRFSDAYRIGDTMLA